MRLSPTMSAAVLALAALAALGACFGTSPQPVYYALDGPSDAASGTPQPFTLAVRRFAIAAPYDRSELVYRTHDLELRFDPYHLWAAPPGRMMAEATASQLRRAQVATLGTRDVNVDYELHGEVLALEERDITETDWRAHLGMRFQLVVARTGAVVWEHAFDTERAVTERTPRAVVAALDAILADELAALARGLSGYLASVDRPGDGARTPTSAATVP